MASFTHRIIVVITTTVKTGLSLLVNPDAGRPPSSIALKIVCPSYCGKLHVMVLDQNLAGIEKEVHTRVSR
jgi:hypothetical protein